MEKGHFRHLCPHLDLAKEVSLSTSAWPCCPSFLCFPARRLSRPEWDGQDHRVVSPFVKTPLNTLGLGCTHHHSPERTCLCQGGKSS